MSPSRRRAFSFVEILVAMLVFLCLMLPVYFVFFSTSRGVEGSVRQLQAVTMAAELMSQVLGVDEQGVRLYPSASTPTGSLPGGWIDVEALRRRYGDAGIPLVTSPWMAHIRSRIQLGDVPSGFARALRFRRIAVGTESQNQTAPSLLEVAVRVQWTKPGAEKLQDYVIQTLLSRPACFKCRKMLGLKEEE